MADGKVLLEVVVEGKNVKVVQREVEQVTSAVNENTKAQEKNSKANRQSASSQQENTKSSRQNAAATRSVSDATNRATGEHAHYDRALKGVHQGNLSGSKSFSKMRDAIDGGSSGLVAAYATLAANMFAATAAFTALQKAAQVTQLSQGLSALGSASGIAMMSLAKGLQNATGYAVNLQDAMRSTALVTSSGFSPKTIERLGKVAKNTSIAMGRDLQDSMNRLVKGAVKLEPELLDELGIMVRIDEASRTYAQSLGKSASQLTNYEKRQAFMNAVLAEGEKKFGAIGEAVGVNPYDKLAANLSELATSVFNAFNTILGPIINFLTQSKLLLGAFILSFSKGIIGAALPALTQMANQTAKLAQRSAELAIIEDNNTKKRIENQKKLITEVAPAPRPGKKAVMGDATLTALKNAKSTDEYTAAIKRAETELTKLQAAEAKAAVTNPQKAAQYNAQAAAITRAKIAAEDLLRVERESASTVPKAKAAGLQEKFYASSAERFQSVREDRSLSNYATQFKGIQTDTKNLGNEVRAMNGQFSSTGRVLSSVGSSLQAYGTQVSASANLTASASASFVNFRNAAAGVTFSLIQLSDSLGITNLLQTISTSTTNTLGKAKTFLTAKIAVLNTAFDSSKRKLLEYITQSRLGSAITSTFGKGLTWLGTKFTILALAADKASVAMKGFIQSSKLAAVAAFEFLAVGASIVAIGMLIYQVGKYIVDAFTSEASKQYSADVDEAKEKTKELTASSNELNLSLLGRSKTITTGMQQAEAEANIIDQVSSSYEKLKNSASKAGKSQEETFSNLEENIKNNDILKRQFQELNPGYSSLTKLIDDKNLTDEEGIQVANKFIEVSSGIANANLNVAKSAKEAADAADQYFNSLKNTTQYSEYLRKIEDVAKAQEEAKKAQEKAGKGVITDQLRASATAITQLSAQEQKAFGVEELVQATDLGNKNLALLQGKLNDINSLNFGESLSNNLWFNADKDVLERWARVSDELKRRGMDKNLPPLENMNQVQFEKVLADLKEKQSKEIDIQTSRLQKLIGLTNEKLDPERETLLNAHKTALELQNIQTKLETIKKINELNGYATSDGIRQQADASREYYASQKADIANQIKLQEQQQKIYNEGTSDRYAVDSKLKDLKQQEILINAEAFDASFRASQREQEMKVKGLEYMQKTERQYIEILNQKNSLEKNSLDIKKKQLELSMQLTSLAAGGTGELSISQQAQISSEQLNERKAAIDNELQIKIRILKLDDAMNKAKFLLLKAEVEAERNKAAQQAKDSLKDGAATRQSEEFQAIANSYGTLLTELNTEYRTLYGEGSILLDRQIKNATLEAQNNKDALEVENKRLKNNSDSKQIYVDIAQKALDAGSQLNDIITKMIDARTSIIDSEQTILENQIKADNRKKTGKGELSLKQEADIQKKFLQKRLDIIEEEKKAKIDMINLEYDLLDAKTRFEQLRLTSEMRTLRDRVPSGPIELPAGLSEADAKKQYDLEIQRRQNANRDIDALESKISDILNNIISKIPGARGLATQAAERGAQAATSTAQEDVAAKAEAAAQQARTLKQRAYETELEFIKSVVDLQQKILDFNNSILDNQRTIDENAQKTANLRNKGIGKFELTAEQNAKIEVDYQEKRKALLLQERDIKLATIEAEYGLLDAQLAVQKWRMQEDVKRLRDEAQQNNDTTLFNRMTELLGNGPNSIEAKFERAAALVEPAMVAAQAAAAKEYEAGVSEATAAQVQAMEEAFGWTTRMTTSWESVSTAIGENFKRTLQESKSITQELADAFTNSVNAAVDGFVDAIVEGKNIFKAIGDGFRNSLRDAFAEMAKNKLKEGIAAIFQAIPGIGDAFKTKEQIASEAAATTSTAIKTAVESTKTATDGIKTATEGSKSSLENIDTTLTNSNQAWDCIKTATETTIPTAVNELKSSIDTSVVTGLTTINDTLINVVNTTLNTINTTLGSILAKPCCESSSQPVTDQMFTENFINALKAALPVQAIPAAATGGMISGPGGPRDDRIPAMLSNGEFVVNAKATQENLKLLQAINSGNLPGFAEGVFLNRRNYQLAKERLWTRADSSEVLKELTPAFLSQLASQAISSVNSELFQVAANELEALGLFGIIKDPMYNASLGEWATQYVTKSWEASTIGKTIAGATLSKEATAAMAARLGARVLGPLMWLYDSWNFGQAVGNWLNENTAIQSYIADWLDSQAAKGQMSMKAIAPGAMPLGKATGGMISGPGGPKDDRIPAMLSNGEFVVNAASTKKYLSLLQAINSGNIPKFKFGTSQPIGGSSPLTSAHPTYSARENRKISYSIERSAEASLDTSVNTKNIDDSVNTWGKIQKFATDNLGDIMTNGLLGVASAISSGRSAKKAFGGAVLGSLGGAVGAALGSFLGPGGAVFGERIGAALGGGIANREFAMGGVMTSSGPLPLEKYAKGGIANSPQLALYGEGRKPEAYVPLPDGRSIPVTMAGSGGGNVNNISVNVSVAGGQAQTQTSAGGKDTAEEQSRKLGVAISNAVKQEIFNQQRPGGLLYKGRK